jgi:hypothetical protein
MCGIRACPGQTFPYLLHAVAMLRTALNIAARARSVTFIDDEKAIGTSRGLPKAME